MADPKPSGTFLSVSDLVQWLDKNEVWRTVAAAPDYEVSSCGRVRRIGVAHDLIQAKTRGYLHVSLCVPGDVETHRVHRLVADAFLGTPFFVGAVVAHNDGDSSNNRVTNLRWATPVENSADQLRHSTRVRGSEVFGAKLEEKNIPELRRRIATGEKFGTIANDYGVSISTVSLIKRNRIWRHA